MFDLLDRLIIPPPNQQIESRVYVIRLLMQINIVLSIFQLFIEFGWGFSSLIQSLYLFFIYAGHSILSSVLYLLFTILNYFVAFRELNHQQQLLKTGNNEIIQLIAIGLIILSMSFQLLTWIYVFLSMQDFYKYYYGSESLSSSQSNNYQSLNQQENNRTYNMLINMNNQATFKPFQGSGTQIG